MLITVAMSYPRIVRSQGNSQLTAAMGRVLVMAPESKGLITVILFISDSVDHDIPDMSALSLSLGGST